VSDGTRGVPAAVRSAGEESYRTLRSTVKFAAGEAPIRSILIVDVDRDMTSGVAEQLARAFARAGDDCALVHTNSSVDTAAPGFTDLVAGTAAAGDVANASDTPHLNVVSAGSIADPDLLAGSRLSDAIDALLQNHAFVVLSSASLPRHADALAIAPRVDAVILVVTSGKTRRGRAIEARDALDRVGARMLGVVMIETRRRLFW
jgi:Mrp family chromosome partitioning ATPase